jgi:hypothetical protein
MVTFTVHWPAAIRSQVGTWEGTSDEIDPIAGAKLSSKRTKIEVGFRGEKYVQRNTYLFADGRPPVVKNFSGSFEGERLVFDAGDIFGALCDGACCVAVGSQGWLFEAHGKGVDAYEYCRLLPGNKRSRIVQFMNDEHVCEKLSVIHETLVSAENPFEE